MRRAVYLSQREIDRYCGRCCSWSDCSDARCADEDFPTCDCLWSTTTPSILIVVAL